MHVHAPECALAYLFNLFLTINYFKLGCSAVNLPRSDLTAGFDGGGFRYMYVFYLSTATKTDFNEAISC